MKRPLPWSANTAKGLLPRQPAGRRSWFALMQRLLAVAATLLLFLPASGAQGLTMPDGCITEKDKWSIRCVITNAVGQNSPTPATAASAPAAGASAAASAASAPVAAASQAAPEKLPNVPAGLRSIIEIYFGDALCLGLEKSTDSVVLYLDHMPLVGLAPMAISKPGGGVCLATFELRRTKGAASTWTALDKKADLQRPPLAKVSVGLGTDDKGERQVIPNGQLDFEPHQPHWVTFYVIVALLLWLILVIAPVKTGAGGSPPSWALLRDKGTLAAGAMVPTYSLARTQFALWLVFALIATNYLWVYTGSLPEITGTALKILLVSGGTIVAAQLVDGASSPLVRQSESFYRDLTNDAPAGQPYSPSLHRLQQVAVTLLLLCAACMTVYRDLAFPEFDDSWILLMGLSAGTYLLGKKSEK